MGGNLLLLFIVLVIQTLVMSVMCSNGSVVAEETLRFLDEGDNFIELDDEHKDIILAVGLSGARKSTFLQFIAGDNDNSLSKLNRYFIEDVVGNRISNSTLVSKTIFPKLIVDQATKQAYYDCPGFNETRTPSMDIAASYFVKKVIDHAERVKFIFALSISTLENRNEFKSFLTHAVSLILNIPNYQDSIALIVTEVTTRMEDSDKIEGIGDTLAETRAELVKFLGTDGISQKSAILQFMDILLTKTNGVYSKIHIFKTPNQEGKLSSLKQMQDSKLSIMNMINELEFRETGKNDFGYAIADESKGFVPEIAGFILQDIGVEISSYKEALVIAVDNKVKSQEEIILLRKIFSNLRNELHDLHTNLTNKPQNMKLTFVTFDNILYKYIPLMDRNPKFRILKLCKHFEFFASLHDVSLLSASDKITDNLSIILNYIQDLVDWHDFLFSFFEIFSGSQFQTVEKNEFITQLNISDRKQYIEFGNAAEVLSLLKKFRILKHDKIHASELDIYKLNTLNAVFKTTLNKPVITNITPNTCQIDGGFIELKQIIDNAKKNLCFTIVVLATHTVIIDSDIELLGKDTLTYELQVFAPNWIIPKNKIVTINLSGKDAINNHDTYVAIGVPGEPGRPGSSGGSFFGLGLHIQNGENLKILANGGKGGAGQTGGEGRAGQDGIRFHYNYFDGHGEHDISTQELTDMGCLVETYAVRRDDDREWRYKIRTKYYYIWAKNGTRGDDGADGGHSGYGGNKGAIKIIGAKDRFGIDTINMDGSQGNVGAGGRGGEGGKRGNLLDLMYEYKWNGWGEHHTKKKVLYDHDLGLHERGFNGRNNGNMHNILRPKVVSNSIYFLPSLIQFRSLLMVNDNDKNVMTTLYKDTLDLMVRDEDIRSSYTIHEFIVDFQALEKVSRITSNKAKLLHHYENSLSHLRAAIESRAF